MGGATASWETPKKIKPPESAPKELEFAKALRKKKKKLPPELGETPTELRIKMQKEYNMYRRPATIRPEDK